MQIFKPLRIGYMGKPIPDRPRSRYAFTGLVCFDLLKPDTLYTEQDMWKTIQPELGELGVLDLWMPKRRGELLVWGRAAAPGGLAVTQMRVNVELGETIQKALTVHGDRHWQPTLLSASISKPSPFVTMPLTHACAFGGPEYPSNPMGKGHAPGKQLDTGVTVRLPNLEYALIPLLHPDQEPAPACFMPLDPTWPGRTPKGTYDEAWLKHCAPAAPLDFEWDIYNLAPLDQRISGYFRGDEDILLEGLHADHPRIRSRLPGLGMRFFSRRNGSKALEELPSVLDSVCLFPSVLRGVLIYRCEMELQQTYEAQEISSVMLACERNHAPRSMDYYEKIFHLRSGKEHSLHVLSDFQLMPEFSQMDQQRLDARQVEVAQERLVLREKKTKWLTAVAAAGAGLTLPEGFFENSKLNEIKVPFVTDLDIELGNVDMFQIKQAASAVTAKLLKESEEFRKDAKQLLVAAELQIDSLREAVQSEDHQSLLALFPPETSETREMGLVVAIVSSLQEIATRVEIEPAWPLKHAVAALSQSIQHSVLAQKSQSGAGFASAEDVATPAGDAFPMDGTAMGSDVDESFEGRQKFVASLREISAALNGQPATDTSDKLIPKEQSAVDTFLQSMGLGNEDVQDSNSRESLKIGNFYLEIAKALKAAPANQIAGIITSLLSGLPGVKNINFSSIEEQLNKATESQPEAFRDIGEALNRPMATDQMAEEIKTIFDLDQIIAPLLEKADNAEKTAGMIQTQAAQERAARLVAAAIPDAVSGNVVDWEKFLVEIGTGGTSLNPSTAPTPPIPETQQALLHALALASGAPGIHRFGPDLPPETEEEGVVRRSLEDFFKQENEAEASGSKAFTSEFLQAHQDAVRAEGSLTAKARQEIVARMDAYAQNQPVSISVSAENRRTLDVLTAGIGSGALSRSIMRDLVPNGEKMLRKGRKKSLIPLISRADLTPEISLGVGALVLKEAGHGVSLAGRDLAGADLQGVCLSGVDLTGAFLEHANLTGTDLSGAHCEGAVFSGACLEGANFSGAFLKGANFGEVRAAKSNFSGADLTGAKFFNADFTSANLNNARLGKCDATKSIFTSANLDGSTCEGGQFLKTTLTGASLEGAHWRRAVFMKAQLSGTSARDACLSDCLFSLTEADSCDFSNAKLDGVVAVACSLKDLTATCAWAPRSSWTQCKLSGADFSGADLKQSNFIKAELDEANFSNAMLRGALFLHAGMRSACLAGAQLYEASMRGADLTGADLRFANLHRTDLENASLDRCDMSGSRRIQSIMEFASVK